MHPPNNPTWWNHSHTSTWDDVKGALERDWEQTKSDLSATGGRQLNQGVADTLLQAAGQETIPPPGVQTHADPGSPADRVLQAARAQPEERPAKATAGETVASQQRGQEEVRWHEAEREVRYGYAVRSQYPPGHEWDTALECKLAGEWDVLTPDHPFRIAKEKIRRGWEYASRKG